MDHGIHKLLRLGTMTLARGELQVGEVSISPGSRNSGAWAFFELGTVVRFVILDVGSQPMCMWCNLTNSR